jgi:hypothetical protein
MRRLLIITIGLTLFLLFMGNPTQAQYRTAVGLRLGGTSGVSVKHQIMDRLYGETILGTFRNGFSLTGLMEKMAPVANVEGLYFYFGGGAHVAVYNGKEIYYSNFGRQVKYHRNNDVALGINLIGGLEYKFINVPISLSMDLKPFVEIGSGGYWGVAPDPSIGLKFTIR